MMLRAQALRQETAVDSISPERAGSIMYDTLAYINQMQLQGANPLLISKIYASVAAMEADLSPVSDLTGEPLRPGQLGAVVPADPESADAGAVYRYDGPGEWTYVGTIGDLPALYARFDAQDAEIDRRMDAQDGRIDGQDQEIADFKEAVQNQIDDYPMITINGNVTNAPDEEDITTDANDLLKFKNRSAVDGMGYVILRKGGDNTFANQVVAANTIYEIRYDFDLSGASVEIPAGCALRFNGGSIANGTIEFQDTILQGADYRCFIGCSLSGSVANEYLLADCIYDSDLGAAIAALFPVVDTVLLAHRKYQLSTTIDFDLNNKRLIGLGDNKVVEEAGYHVSATEVECVQDIHAVSIENYNCELRGIRFRAAITNTHAGVYTYHAVLPRVIDCAFDGFGVGIHFAGGYNCLAERNLIYSCVFGIVCSATTAQQINGARLVSNHIKFCYGGLYLWNSNCIEAAHNICEVVHPDYKDRTITYFNYNYPLSAAIIVYLSKNATFRDTYVEGANNVMYDDTSSRCIVFDNLYYNSHINETYVKPFTGNFFGSAHNVAISGVYFAVRVNETTGLVNKRNGVIRVYENCRVSGCVCSYVLVEGNNTIIGQNVYETERFGGVVFANANSTSVVLPFGLTAFGATTDRPSFNGIPAGFQFFDKTLGRPIWNTGSGWVDAAGNAV